MVGRRVEESRSNGGVIYHRHLHTMVEVLDPTGMLRKPGLTNKSGMEYSGALLKAVRL